MKIAIALICFFVIAITAIGQVDHEQNQITDTVVVTKDLKLEKINLTPYILEYETTTSDDRPINSDVVKSEEVDVTYPEPPLNISPIRFTHRRDKSGNDGMLKVSYGIPNAIDTELLYDYHIEDWYHIGLNAGYTSADDDRRQDMRYNNWGIGIFGGYWLTPNLKLSLDTNFSRLKQAIYGESIQGENIHPDRLIQSIDNSLGFGLNKYESLGLQLDGVFRYEATELIDEVSQQNYLSADLHLAKRLWQTMSLDITGKAESASIIGANNLTNYNLNPSLRYTNKHLHTEVGIYSSVGGDDDYFWPKVIVQYKVDDLPLELKLSTHQSPYITTLNVLAQKNPFINTDATIPTQLTIERQVEFSMVYVQNNFLIHPSYTYELTDNQLLYERGDITFDLINSDQISSHQLGLDIEYSLSKLGDINLESRLYLYSSFVETFTTYLPKYEAKISANQNFINDKLRLEQAVYYRQVTADSELITTPIFGEFNPNIIDLSASANYEILPNFWLYAEGNNLLFQDYTIWQGYGVFQPKILAGIKYFMGNN